ncbi:MAG TPA: biopolymer transporter ExbD [Porticoccaceae bacterium]|nr:biopolymer transporter ExbD [Porticoccaceae bacterium]
MKFRRQAHRDQGVNLTPLIDVVFLLLIFFMVSTTFTRQTELVVNLPEADAAPSETQAKSIDVLITADGNYSLNGIALVNTQIKTLMAGLKELSAGRTDIPLTITADANVRHQAVVTAMDAAGRLGFGNLSIITQAPEDAR